MGAVWRVRDRRLDRVVALKQLRQLDEELAERFRREACTLAALQDPHIVQVIDHGEADDQVYLVMELVEGRPFDRLGPGVDPLPGWMQIGEALQTVHDQGIIHRDVKPANAVLDRHGRAVLLDFGLVHDPGKRTLTKTGHVIGSLAYLAPELLQGAPATPQADWYSWGASLFQLLEGRLPFDNQAIVSILEGEGRPAPDYQRLGPDHRLRPALELLLQVDPRDRPATWPDVRALIDDPEDASLRLVATPTREDMAPSPLLQRGTTDKRRPLGPLVLATGLGLLLATWAARPLAVAPPAPPTEERANSAGPAGSPEAVRKAAANLYEVLPPPWKGRAKEADRGQVDAYVDTILDPRVPLAYQRYLDVCEEWLEELGSGGANLGAQLRRPEVAPEAREYLFEVLVHPLYRLRGPRGWYERSMQAHPDLGRRLVGLNERDVDLAGRLGTFLLEVDDRHEHLPPLLVAAAVFAKPLPQLVASGRDPRPAMPVIAQEVPEDTPFAFPIAQAALRQLIRSLPTTAVGMGGAAGLKRCAAFAESARLGVEIYDRLSKGLGVAPRQALLVDGAYLLELCIRRCPPAFQDRLSNAHQHMARRILTMLEEHPVENPSLPKRRDYLAQTFHEEQVWGAEILTPPASPPR